MIITNRHDSTFPNTRRSIIASSTASEEYARSHMVFRWQVFRVMQPCPVNPAKNLDNFMKDIGQPGHALFDEAAMDECKRLLIADAFSRIVKRRGMAVPYAERA